MLSNLTEFGKPAPKHHEEAYYFFDRFLLAARFTSAAMKKSIFYFKEKLMMDISIERGAIVERPLAILSFITAIYHQNDNEQTLSNK